MHPGAQFKPTGEYLGYELSWLHGQSKHHPPPQAQQALGPEAAASIKAEKQRQNLKKRREAAIWPTKQGPLLLKARADHTNGPSAASPPKAGAGLKERRLAASMLARSGKVVGAAKRKRSVVD